MYVRRYAESAEINTIYLSHKEYSDAPGIGPGYVLFSYNLTLVGARLYTMRRSYFHII